MNFRKIIISSFFILILHYISFAEIPFLWNDSDNEILVNTSARDNTGIKNLPGKRNKFIFSIGAGPGLSILNIKDIFGNPENTRMNIYPCLSTNFRIGYAPSNKFFVCWNTRTNWFRSKAGNQSENYSWFSGGGSGLGISFFPFKNNPSFYFNGLFGYSQLGQDFDFDINNVGTEIVVGAGYIFSNHLSTELNFQAGTSKRSYYDSEISNPVIINLTVNYIFWKK